MRDKIAVLLDEEGHLSSFMESSVVHIYEKTSVWQVIQRIQIQDIADKRENDIGKFTLALIENLKCCKVIVGTLILGVPYYLLVRASFEVCEAASFSTLLLEQIYEDYCKLSEATNSEDKDVVQAVKISNLPIPIDEAGNFFIDMIAVQKAYPKMSSKKILLPFFSDTLFNSLSIKCSHVMPWLENYLEQRGLVTYIIRQQGSYTVRITHKLC